MGSDDFGGGLWILVAINSAIFILFAASFFHPRTGRDWKVMGTYSAFIVALFIEMYGFPLTIYLLSGWLGSSFPALVPTHAGGHLLNDLIGWQGDPHLSPFHLASYVVMGAGIVILAKAWPVLWAAQREERMAVTGPYARVRHPQYLGFLLIMAGFLLQWPTLLTLLMFPVLAVAYTRLAISEEAEVRVRFGAGYEEYATRTPRFIPRSRRRQAANVGAPGSAARRLVRRRAAPAPGRPPQARPSCSSCTGSGSSMMAPTRAASSTTA